MVLPGFLAPTLLGVGVLAAITVAVLRLAGSPRIVAPVLAILRGALQLAVLSVVLTGVIRSPVWVALALAVMFAVAAVTAGRRLGGGRRVLLAAAAMGTGALTALVVVFATGALELSARYALAIGGIVVGNTMSIATLAGRRLLESVSDRWEEVEAWLAIGATPRVSVRDLGRRAVSGALLPTVDQTRTTGLVTLPGAFVGAIFGGVSPLEAGRFQIVVLASIMAAGTVTAVLVVHGLSGLRERPEPL